MKSKWAIILGITLSTFFVLLKSPALAEGRCGYADTQARVQRDTNDPWKREIWIRQGDRFNVGSFHNGVDTFAKDTIITIIEPDGRHYKIGNGENHMAVKEGVYVIKVSTVNQGGWDCQGEALVRVERVQKPPTQSSCQYGSTQARVQTDIYHNWQKEIKVKEGEHFNVGSFHNESGQFAGDTVIRVTKPNGTSWQLSNGERVHADMSGTYQVKVSTKNQSGGGCEAEAQVRVDPVVYKGDARKPFIDLINEKRMPTYGSDRWWRLYHEFKIWWSQKLAEMDLD